MKLSKKYIFILTIILIILLNTSCLHRNNNERYYLNKIYYGANAFTKVNSSQLNKLIEKKDSFILYTYNNYCALPISCEDIFMDFMKEYKISFISIPFDDFKDTKFYEEIKYGPTIIIIKEGQIIDYLDSNKNDDIEKYKDLKAFKKWLSNYIYLKGK